MSDREIKSNRAWREECERLRAERDNLRTMLLNERNESAAEIERLQAELAEMSNVSEVLAEKINEGIAAENEKLRFKIQILEAENVMLSLGDTKADEIERLRAEVASMKVAAESAIEYVAEREREECEKTRAELERERMRLAACGVVALSDTPESAANARAMHDDYKSASCDDVARRVDECMRLRDELADERALRQEHQEQCARNVATLKALLREALGAIYTYSLNGVSLHARIRAALGDEPK